MSADKMTDAERSAWYVAQIARTWANCPACQNKDFGDFRRESPVFAANRATANVYCRCCDAHWVEQWTLTGITDIKEECDGE